MRRALATFVVLAACGGGAQLQTVELVNHTSRQIEAVYVYPAGSSRGASRGALAPNAITHVQIQAGNVEVYAVSAKMQVDEHTRDVPEASQQLELRGPAKVVFYDGDDKPADINNPGVYGIAFSIPKPKPPPPDEPTAP